jgi:mycoredoxin
VYWRPGCGYCSGLLRSFERYEVPHERRNIWEDPEAAEEVRAAARGSETVPTVQVGPVLLVNPSMGQVLATAHELDPDTDLPPPPAPGKVARALTRLLGGSLR